MDHILAKSQQNNFQIMKLNGHLLVITSVVDILMRVKKLYVRKLNKQDPRIWVLSTALERTWKSTKQNKPKIYCSHNFKQLKKKWMKPNGEK